MKKTTKILSLVLCSAFFAFSGIHDVPAYAGTLSGISNASIKEKQNQIAESQKKKQQLQSNITNAKKIKKELENLKASVSDYITKLDAEVAQLEENIEEYKGLITEKEGEIEVITGELNEAIEVENNQYESMKKRIKFMYECGDSFALELMVNASSFGDFLSKANYVEKLSEYSQKKLDEYKAVREWTALCKETLEAEKEVLDTAKANLEAEEAAVQELLNDKRIELENYKKQIAEKEQQIVDYESDLESNTAAIAALEAAVLAEQKAIAAANGIVLSYDGGKFTWPAPSYVAITDDFGYRTDPINGRTSYHSGIDMGAPGGSPILAAYDGVVVAAAYDSSMGNYVMINHGDGLYTVYMHSSKLLVKKDDIVIRGEKIALVGTTGRSTGNHLHFSVRKNGQYVSPWPYLKK